MAKKGTKHKIKLIKGNHPSSLRLHFLVSNLIPMFVSKFTRSKSNTYGIRSKELFFILGIRAIELSSNYSFTSYFNLIAGYYKYNESKLFARLIEIGLVNSDRTISPKGLKLIEDVYIYIKDILNKHHNIKLKDFFYFRLGTDNVVYTNALEASKHIKSQRFKKKI